MALRLGLGALLRRVVCGAGYVRARVCGRVAGWCALLRARARLRVGGEWRRILYFFIFFYIFLCFFNVRTQSRRRWRSTMLGGGGKAAVGC